MLNFDFDLNRIRQFYHDNEKTVRMAAFALIVGLSILIFWIHGDSRTHVIAESDAEISETQSVETDGIFDSAAEEDPHAVTSVYVDISGEVRKPGVYKADSDTRLFEVIEMAGGLTENADPDSLNRAEKVWDGEKIIVLSYDESEERRSSSSPSGGTADSAESGKVNINTADSAELQTIPGIGPSKAQAILDYREENGYFTAPEDIMNVTGIGQKSFASIKDYIVI